MSNIKLFEDKKIRSQWNADQEKWYFSIVDVIAISQIVVIWSILLGIKEAAC